MCDDSKKPPPLALQEDLPEEVVLSVYFLTDWFVV